MAIIYKNLKGKLFDIGPLLLLYFLSISELDTQFANTFEILSFNLQLIIIYYWMLRREAILGNGYIFFAGIINDVIIGLPMGTSSLSYLIVSFFASYVRNVTVNISLFTDWLTFSLAVFFSSSAHYILLENFTIFKLTYTELFYTAFFTILFYPFFWFVFNYYKYLMSGKDD
ncbi:MAG: hypothetical protein ACJZ4O_02915 [Pelagibacteraceae bacterium]